jgi:hypothetical protein
LTPHNTKASDSAPAEESAGGGAPDIEITPEMIEAGVDILADYDPEYDGLSGTVAKLLRVALSARR